MVSFCRLNSTVTEIGGLSGSVFFVTCPGVCFSLPVRERVFRYLSGSVFFVTCPGATSFDYRIYCVYCSRRNSFLKEIVGVKQDVTV